MLIITIDETSPSTTTTSPITHHHHHPSPSDQLPFNPCHFNSFNLTVQSVRRNQTENVRVCVFHFLFPLSFTFSLLLPSSLASLRCCNQAIAIRHILLLNVVYFVYRINFQIKIKNKNICNMVYLVARRRSLHVCIFISLNVVCEWIFKVHQILRFALWFVLGTAAKMRLCVRECKRETDWVTHEIESGK